jgi:hypothetical protein
MLDAVTMAKRVADVTPEQLRQLSQRCCRLAENSVEPTISPALWSVALQLAMLAEVSASNLTEAERTVANAITCHPLFGPPMVE